MACHSCGEKPKCNITNNGFTKAVIKIDNPESLVLLRKVVVPASMGTEEKYPVEVGKYSNVLLEYEANNHIYIYSSDGIPTNMTANISELEKALEELGVELGEETVARIAADEALEQEIEDLRNSPDVVDIVANYAELEAYDTSTLGDKDVIRVLTDETHDDESTYYRWDKPNSQWVFIGAVEGYYTKAQTDTLLATKQNVLTPGTNIQIVEDTISATDTTYTAGNGLSLEGTEFSADTSVLQEKLTAGTNVQINGATISATDTTYSAGTGLDLTGTQFSVDTTEIQEKLAAGSNIQINGTTISATDTTYTAGSGLDLTGTEFSVDTTTIQPKLTAGSNITIDANNEISATDTTYTAGTGLDLNGTEFSVDTTAIQEKLTAGANITIDANNEISATDTTYTAGTNINISNENVISATDTTYTAGSGLDLTGTEFSVDSTVVALKTDLPTKTSDLSNDGSDGTSTYVEADELATVATSGSYNDLLNKPTIPAAQVNSDWNATSGVAEILNKPTIPVVNNATLTIQKNSTSVGTFTANASSNKTINITVPTTAADVSALPASTKYGASFVASINTTTYVMTMTLKDQDGNTLGTAQTVDLPLESVVVNGSYDSSTKEVVLTLQGGSTIRFSVADLVSGLQTEITSSNKLSADLVDDSTTTNKFVTASDKTTWNAKQNALAAGSNIQINGSTISATDTTYSNYTGATSQTAGTAGLVPAPAAGDETKFLSGNGQWTTVSQYSLPIATANDLGGVKVGANLSIDPSTGVLSADAQQVTLYSSTGQNTDGAMTQKATTDALGLKADTSSLATVATSGSYNDLTNKPTIPAAQIQSNWTQTTTTALDYIKNKPNLATVATSGSYNDLTNKPSIPAAQVQSDWTQSDNTKVDYIKNKPSLATVATSGSYNDLSNKPTIPTVNNATLTIQKNGTTVKTFTANASSNVTANITVPTKTSDLTNDGADNTSTYVEADELAAVATSGSYNDLSNKPTIPAAQIQSDWTQTTTTAKDYIKNKPNLATVATSGSYNDLSNKPTIPTVNNATLTIQRNGTTVKTFTANASSNVTANITVPTKTSDLSNDSNFVASTALATVATSGSYNDLTNKPTIPTVNNGTLTVTQNGTSKGTFTANQSGNATIALTDTTYSAFTGTDGTSAGTAGLVPAPATTDAGKFLKADGSWDTVAAPIDVFTTNEWNALWA